MIASGNTVQAEEKSTFWPGMKYSVKKIALDIQYKFTWVSKPTESTWMPSIAYKFTEWGADLGYYKNSFTTGFKYYKQAAGTEISDKGSKFYNEVSYYSSKFGVGLSFYKEFLAANSKYYPSKLLSYNEHSKELRETDYLKDREAFNSKNKESKESLEQGYTKYSDSINHDYKNSYAVIKFNYESLSTKNSENYNKTTSDRLVSYNSEVDTFNKNAVKAIGLYESWLKEVDDQYKVDLAGIEETYTNEIA